MAITAVSTTSITLTWNPSRDNVGVAGYGVYVNGARVASTAPRSYKQSSLTCGTTYKLGVDAYDAARNRSGVVSVLAATAPCLDATPPTAPKDVHQSSWSHAGAGVEWSGAADNVGIAGYSIYRDGVPIVTTQQSTAWVPNLVCGAGYSVSVEAFDAAGNHSSRTTAVVNTTSCADTTAPSAPRNLRVSGSTSSTITVGWEPSSDDRGVAEYRVSLESLDLRTTTGTTASFTGLGCGRSYIVKVAAADAAGNVSPSASVSAPTSPCPSSSVDTQPPTMPTGLLRRDATATSVTLSWNASTDNVGVAGYGIYRAGIKVADANVTAAEVQGLACATSYTFAVDAVDVNGLRSARATVIAMTEPCPGTTAPSAPTTLTSQSRTETSITLSWQASTGASGYRVYRDGTLAGSTSSTSYTVTGLSCGKSYTLGVDAYDGSGNHSTRSATIISTAGCSDTVPPSAPASFVATSSTATSVGVSWSPSSDDTAVAGYSLFVAGSSIGATSQTSYTFPGLTCGTTYTLGTEAYDAAGNRSQRVSISANTTPCAQSAPAPQPTGSTAFAANVYLAASGGSSSCVRSASPRTYSEALAAVPTNVCNTFDTACSAATAGDIVGVKNGNYTTDDAGRNAILMDNGDCSDGGGANTNPNGTSIPSGWVSFQCGDGASTPRSVDFPAGNFDIEAKIHAEFKGRCFGINLIHAGNGGSTTLVTQYARFDDVYFFGLECAGCRDFAFLNSDTGPGIFCYPLGGPFADAQECSSSGPPWEAQYTSTGSYNSSGMELYLHQNSGPVYPANLSFINVYFHDKQAKNGPANDLHTGCFQTENMSGLVIDRSRFERCAVEPLLIGDTFTLQNATIQNTMFGCNTDTWDNSGGTYDQVATGSRKTIDSSGNLTNVLIRYNTFCTQAIFDPTDTYTNVRMIGNLFLATGTKCSITGATFDYNAVVGGTCGTNSTNVSAGLVVNRGDTDTNCVFCSPLLDHHLTGSSVTGVDNAVTPTSSDYALTYDYDNGSRTPGSRDVGADER